MDVRPAAPMQPIRDCRPSIVRTHSDVRAELVDRVVRYDVEERFVNRGAMVGEADYFFPLPANAAFQDLSLSIDGELVSGETMDAAKARGIYESIVRARRDPALVEWMGHGLLHARIFPINPGEEKRVVVRFQSVAPREGDALRVDYVRGAAQQQEQQVVRPYAPGRPLAGSDTSRESFTLTYRLSPELGTPYSPTHALDISDHDGRREVKVRGDARDLTLLIPVRRNAAAAISVLPYAPGNQDGFALITVTPPVTSRAETTPRDVTLVLDVSGSMQGRKIEQARAAARQLLGTLRPQDRFRLIDFSSDVRTFKDDFAAASAENIRDASKYIDALEAQGGTNIEGALREAVRPNVTPGRLPLILFVTDGEPTIGDGNPDHLAAIATDAARSGGLARRRIFTFGLGSDVNASLLEQLALEGRGTAQFVRPDESVERMMGIVANRLVDPVLTDVRVRVEGSDVKLSKILPNQASDAFADRDLVMLARYSGHGPARVIVEGTKNGASVQWTTAVNFPDRDRQNPFVARLWATQRIGFLSAEERKNGAPRVPEVEDEIKALGEEYGIPTEFTSYLVTEPQLVVNRTALIGGRPPAPALAPALAPASAAAPAVAAFERARVASAQRTATSLVALDSMAAFGAKRAANASNASNASGVSGASGVPDASTRHVDGRIFTLRDGVWVDQRVRSGVEVLSIQPYSRAYFDLLDKLPELRPVFALGSRVIVAGRNRVIEVKDTGVTVLSAAALASLTKAW